MERSLERDRLRRTLEIPAQIEHIGSTAVVGLGGKGILDVATGVASQDRPAVREQLTNDGYEYCAKASTASRDSFRDYLRRNTRSVLLLLHREASMHATRIAVGREG